MREFISSASELAISWETSFSKIEEMYLAVCLLDRVPSLHQCALRYFVKLLARRTVPILFRCNALPFKCFVSSIF